MTAPIHDHRTTAPIRVLLADDHTLVRRGCGSSWTPSRT